MATVRKKQAVIKAEAESVAPAGVQPLADSDNEGLPIAVLSLRILEALARAETDCGITELAQAMGIGKARIYRHLDALRDYGYVVQNQRTSRYGIGWRLFILGQNLAKGSSLGSLARPYIETLRDTVRHTIVISAISDGEVVVLDYIAGGRTLDIGLKPGARFKPHSAAQGKIAMAFGPESFRTAALAGPLEELTSRTITDPETLQAELDKIRQQGWADAPEELFVGVNAIAAPIWDAAGTLAGIVTVVGSVHYLPQPADPSLVAALRGTARGISEALGFEEPPSNST